MIWRTLFRAVCGPVLACALLYGLLPASAAFAGIPLTHATPASPTAHTAIVSGLTTTWRLTLLHTRSMNRIPHTSFWGYTYNTFRWFILTLRLANTGHHTANLEDDLTLALQSSTSLHNAGSQLPRTRPFIVMMQAAAREFGGVVPWTPTKPGHSTLYCVVIATPPGGSHYGLFNDLPNRPPLYLLNTGV